MFRYKRQLIVNYIKKSGKCFTKVFIFKIFVFIIIMALLVWLRVAHLKQLRRDIIMNDDFSESEPSSSYHDFDVQLARNTEDTKKVRRIKDLIKNANEKQSVLNEKKLGRLKSDSSVIVIQVEGNLVFLSALVESLLFMNGITRSVLIFCHNHYDEKITAYVKNITFAKIVQIYNPFSSQIYPNSFPGDDGKFCTGDFQCELSVLRVAKYSLKKHFWWWKINFVFDSLRVLETYDGNVLFLSENEYVLKDTIYVLKVMQYMKRVKCPDCDVISLGAHKPRLDLYKVIELNLTIGSWDTMELSVGLCFNRFVWSIIKTYSVHFCRHNDYRWQASLRNLVSKIYHRQFLVMASEASRVLRYRTCKDSYCSVQDPFRDMEMFVDSVGKAMFPLHIQVVHNGRKAVPVQNAGGWDDVRDQELCMYMVNHYGT